MESLGLEPIPIEGKTVDELYESIAEVRAEWGLVLPSDLRFMAGTLAEPFELTFRDESGEWQTKSVEQVSAGDKLWGVLVV